MHYRPDRKILALQELDKLGLKEKAICFSGIETTEYDSVKNRWMGCNLSHLTILEQTKDDERILVFEDDFLLINDFLTIINNAIKDLETRDWGMFYLGGNICSTIKQETQYLGRLSHAQTTHSYAVNRNFAKTILQYKTLFYDKHVDLVYAQNIIPNYPCYITIPMITVQRADRSDILQQNVNYSTWMEERFFNNLERM